MARTPRDVTETELKVLQALWEHGPSTVRAVAEELYERPSTGQVAGVQTLLTRLEKNKGYVRRRKGESSMLYEATVAKDDLIGSRLKGIAEELCEGSMTPLLTHLVQRRQLSPDELRSLRDLIDELDS